MTVCENTFQQSFVKTSEQTIFGIDQQRRVQERVQARLIDKHGREYVSEERMVQQQTLPMILASYCARLTTGGGERGTRSTNQQQYDAT